MRGIGGFNKLSTKEQIFIVGMSVLIPTAILMIIIFVQSIYVV